MALKRRLFLIILILASVLTATSCANHPISPNYAPSGAIKEKLQEAAQAFGRDLPIPTYLPEGYAISEVQVIPQSDTYEHVVLTITNPDAPDIMMQITWFHGPFRLLPASERYKYFDISGGPGTYSKAVLCYLSDRNDLWWDWTPVAYSTGSPSEYYEMVLSAGKDVPDDEMVNIARYVRLPQS